MAIEESAILTAIANWIGVVGIPAVVGWNLRLVSWGHKQDLAIRDLENRVEELQKTGSKIDHMSRKIEEIRGDMIELKTIVRLAFGDERDGNDGNDRNRRRRAGD
jgi:hypothetical protein